MITKKDVYREFSRLNFRHVNDLDTPIGPLSEEYCMTVLILLQELKAANEVVQAAKRFKRSFEKGFHNSLNAIEARDEIFTALECFDGIVGVDE